MKNKLIPVKMITILALDSLKDRIITDIRNCGARGYTVAFADGEGLHQAHLSDWEGRVVRIETLANEQIAGDILDIISEKYFDKYGIIAFQSTVEVVRPGRF